MFLSPAVTTLKGVGPHLNKKLSKMGIRKVEDILFHFPIRYQDRTMLCPIGEAKFGRHVLVHGEILVSSLKLGRRSSLITIISDGTGRLTLRQFHYNRSQRRSLQRGMWLQCFGELRSGPSGPELVHPEYQIISGRGGVQLDATLTPIYPTTKGLGQKMWRKLTDEVLSKYDTQTRELLPESLVKVNNFLTIKESLQIIHRPPTETDIAALSNRTHPAQLRLAFEELLAHHLAMTRRRQLRDSQKAPEIPIGKNFWPKLEKRLDFTLTQAQSKTIQEIFSGLSQNSPSLRLVQGDVGCGKTIVAVAAALAAVEVGLQVAIMAPTEILAAQHFQTFSSWLKGFNLKTVWLTSKLGGKEKKEVYDFLVNGKAQIVIGTHALFQEDVQYKSLGLIIVDEQHRFGVEQRASLRDKGQSSNQVPHQIIMTATPIPRSLAMVVYADMDISIIDEMPPGRQTAETAVMPNARRVEVQKRVREACKSGQKAYWVCPLINESEALEVEAVVQRSKTLQKELPDVRVSSLHGKTGVGEKEEIMTTFRAGTIDLLVASTVIEVGVHVPEATLMVVENAERLGLLQLHQLRGRIGRSDQRSVCIFLYQNPLTTVARNRLVAIRELKDGFMVAKKDLELRGPGEILGTRQSGIPEFRIADLFRHSEVAKLVPDIADYLQTNNPQLVDEIIDRWLLPGEYSFTV
ncbi:MAG: ATP-dependent DNA helicase RecG [Acidiferrobacteraceae bacterium]|nr:ATP-dependent DNA helicase RecG [Acidiferrobacteraceae bacterium]